ncbi:MAG: hypothetical protein IKJ24_01165 [Clostridia bacterium]|nr:hypothetical protein [Clostridia bacterium]
MTNDEIVKAIAENTQRSKSNSHRIDDLEKNGELLHKMVTALEVLATQQKNVAEQVERIDSKVTRLEESPMRRIRTIVGYIVAALCSAAAGAVFSGGFDLTLL